MILNIMYINIYTSVLLYNMLYVISENVKDKNATCMHMYIYIYIYVCVCISIYIYICLYIYMCSWAMELLN